MSGSELGILGKRVEDRIADVRSSTTTWRSPRWSSTDCFFPDEPLGTLGDASRAVGTVDTQQLLAYHFRAKLSHSTSNDSPKFPTGGANVDVLR